MNASFEIARPPTLLADVATTLIWLPSITMIAGILIMGAIMAISFNRRERQLRTLAMQVSNDLEEAKALRTQLDEAHTLASNMMVTAQRLSARLDERVTALDMASLRMSATRNALPRFAAQNAAHHRSRSAPPANDFYANGYATDDSGMSLSPVLTSIEHAMAPPKSHGRSAIAMMEPPSRASIEMKPAMDPFTQHVYELADAGQPAVAIARELNEHVGKIELILALRR